MDANPSPPEAPPSNRPKRDPRRQRKPQFSRFEAVGDRSKAIAGRIFEFLAWAGPQTKRQIERRLHSCRYPEWKDAWEHLLWEGAISVEDGQVKIMDAFADERRRLPHPYAKVPEPKKKRRKRPQSEWFRNVYRRSEEEGKAISDILEEDRLNQPE